MVNTLLMANPVVELARELTFRPLAPATTDSMRPDYQPLLSPGVGEVVIERVGPQRAVTDGEIEHDLAGVVTAVGPRVTRFIVGDEVMGWTRSRSPHPSRVTAAASRLIHKLPHLNWDAARSLYSVGTLAWAAVDAIDPQPGETVAVSGAESDSGRIVVQLLARRGARVIAVCAPEWIQWMTDHDAIPVSYGYLLHDRLRAAGAADGVDGFVNMSTSDHLDVAARLGIAPHRVATTTPLDAPRHGEVKTIDRRQASTLEILCELAYLVAGREIDYAPAN